MAAAPTEEELATYYEKDQERLAASRRAENLKKSLEPMRKRLDEYAKKHGGADRTTTRFGYVIRMQTGKRYPNWKELFIGETSAERAEEEHQKTPTSDYVVVEKAAAT